MQQSNFALALEGADAAGRLGVCLIDFGLARRYTTNAGNVREVNVHCAGEKTQTFGVDYV